MDLEMNNYYHLPIYKEMYLYSVTLPMSGNRNNSNGTVNNEGTNGYYWSGSVNSTNARNMNFNSSAVNPNNNNRANGFSVRCLKINKEDR